MARICNAAGVRLLRSPYGPGGAERWAALRRLPGRPARAARRALPSALRRPGAWLPIALTGPRPCTMIFRQLFEPLSCTYTYLLGCHETGQAILIDPVIETMERDLATMTSLGLRSPTRWTPTSTPTTSLPRSSETAWSGARSPTGHRPSALRRHQRLEEGQPFTVGSITLSAAPHARPHRRPLRLLASTDRVFTGDALLIDGCGRTDFQNGDTDALYPSVTASSSRCRETSSTRGTTTSTGTSLDRPGKRRNPRLGGARRRRVRAIMANLNLPYPKFIDYAVPGNRLCGVCPDTRRRCSIPTKA